MKEMEGQSETLVFILTRLGVSEFFFKPHPSSSETLVFILTWLGVSEFFFKPHPSSSQLFQGLDAPGLPVLVICFGMFPFCKTFEKTGNVRVQYITTSIPLLWR